MFNGIFRSLLETYLLLVMQTLLEVSGLNRTGMEVTAEVEEFSSINYMISLVMTAVLLALPIFVYCLLVKIGSDRLRDPKMKAKIDSLYQNLDYYRKEALCFTPLFLLRRFFFAFSVVLLTPTNLFLQVVSIDIACMAMLAYFFIVKPMDAGQHNFIQIFNEISFMVVLFFLFSFTNFSDTPEIMYRYGYFVLYFIAF
jgi:hypothetical protein